MVSDADDQACACQHTRCNGDDSRTRRILQTAQSFGGNTCFGLHFSADGERILTSSEDGSARLWSAGNTQALVILMHRGRVSSAEFNRDETRVLTASADGTARLWDLSFDDSIPIRQRILEFEVRSGTTLAADGELRVLSVSEWEQRKAALLRSGVGSTTSSYPATALDR